MDSARGALVKRGIPGSKRRVCWDLSLRVSLSVLQAQQLELGAEVGGSNRNPTRYNNFLLFLQALQLRLDSVS